MTQETENQEEKRYHIRALAPDGTAPGMEAKGLQVIVKGEMTPGEYLETFGDGSINHAMCLQTCDQNEYTRKLRYSRPERVNTNAA